MGMAPMGTDAHLNGCVIVNVATMWAGILAPINHRGKGQADHVDTA